MKDEDLTDNALKTIDRACKVLNITEREETITLRIKKEPLLDVLACDGSGKLRIFECSKVIYGLNRLEVVEENEIAQPFFAALPLLKGIKS